MSVEIIPQIFFWYVFFFLFVRKLMTVCILFHMAHIYTDINYMSGILKERKPSVFLSYLICVVCVCVHMWRMRLSRSQVFLHPFKNYAC